MNKRDFIRLININKNAKECKEKFIRYANEKDDKISNIFESSKKQMLYNEWVVAVSNLIDDIKNTNYLFDGHLYSEMEKYFNSTISDNRYYKFIGDKNYRIRDLLDSVRDRKTHSVKTDREIEYKLFYLIIDENVMIKLFNYCARMIDKKIENLSFEDCEKLIKSDADIIIKLYKLQEYFNQPCLKKLVESLDDKKFKGHKEQYNKFINFKFDENSIFLLK